MIKVEPKEEHEGQFKAQKSKNTKLANYFVISVWSLAGFLGLLPFKYDKETKNCSFKWFSSETIFSFVRLVLFNFPSTILPTILYIVYFNNEWNDEPNNPFQGGKTDAENGTRSNSSSSARLSSAELVQTIDYFTNCSLFILSKLQKHWGFMLIFLSIVLQQKE